MTVDPATVVRPGADRARSGTDWVAPETPAERGPVPGRGVAEVDVVRSGLGGIAVARGDARPARGRDGSGAVSMEANPLARLSVTGPGGILDGGFDLFRFRFRRLVGLAATIFLPLQLLDLVVSLTVGAASSTAAGSAGEDLGLAGLSDLSTAGSDGWGVASILLRSIGLCLLGISVGYLVAAWIEGEDRTYRQAMLYALRRVWVAPVIVVVGALVKLPLACLGLVGWFLGDALLFVAGIAAGAERLGPFAAVGRSFRLTRGAYGVALVVCIGGFVITFVLQFALTLGPLLLLAAVSIPEGWLVVVEQASSLVLLIALPVTACIAARAYVDLRCRTEGLDLQVHAARDGLV